MTVNAVTQSALDSQSYCNTVCCLSLKYNNLLNVNMSTCSNNEKQNIEDLDVSLHKTTKNAREKRRREEVTDALSEVRCIHLTNRPISLYRWKM